MGGHVCSICLSAEASPFAALPCGHVLHFVCITQCLKVTGRCPACRSTCTERDVVRLYLETESQSAVDKGQDNKSESAEDEQAPQQITKQQLEDLQADHAELAVLKERVIPGLKEELRNSRAELDDIKPRFKMMLTTLQETVALLKKISEMTGNDMDSDEVGAEE